ncbi:uncharacterized protein LOC119080235 [Bradysia coprophila]|uniref:uncharacterized protein LOC119080235 n=1 Tax=Bradysia coprophila TaxID=38358 RepID=UPI00187D8953|nr:uncharacterized protein LOC119080235 [Bradysia coprophila]XP_037044381.1 uncharacterized protein LOC119080235 [Bradysia coprophila]XP_037044382.1 uncharacterized protein LOC119080235 [Bradysia coprophila]
MQHNQERRILKYYLDNLWRDKTFRLLKNIGFVDILADRALGANANFDTFLAEIDRAAKDQKYRRNSIEYETVLELKDDWAREIVTIRPCIDCYELWTTHETNKDYFTSACATPHLLVHTRDRWSTNSDDPRMWPAKVISVYNCANNMVIIDFFGDHLRAEYPFEECFLYSSAEECAQKEANAQHAFDPTIKKQNEYTRSFEEVEKYIRNMKQKFGFVPAATKVAITDIRQHLIDMFPSAFKQSPADIFERQTKTTTAEANNTVEELHAGQATIHCDNRFVHRMVSPPLAQCYVSRASLACESDETSTNLDENFVDQNRIERTPIDIKTEIAENVPQCSVDANNVSPSGTTDGGDLIKDEILNRPVIDIAAGYNENGKRTADTMIDLVVNTAGDDDNGSGAIPTSQENVNEWVTMNRGNFDALLDEFAEVKAKIWKNEEHQKKLETELIRLKQEEENVKAMICNLTK